MKRETRRRGEPPAGASLGSAPPASVESVVIMIDDRTNIPRLVVDHTYTHDARAPLCVGDENFNCGWQSIPVPPDLSSDWQIFDTGKDYRTGWRRIRIEWGRA